MEEIVLRPEEEGQSAERRVGRTTLKVCFSFVFSFVIFFLTEGDREASLEQLDSAAERDSLSRRGGSAKLSLAY